LQLEGGDVHAEDIGELATDLGGFLDSSLLFLLEYLRRGGASIMSSHLVRKMRREGGQGVG